MFYELHQHFPAASLIISDLDYCSKCFYDILPIGHVVKQETLACKQLWYLQTVSPYLCFTNYRFEGAWGSKAIRPAGWLRPSETLASKLPAINTPVNNFGLFVIQCYIKQLYH